MKENKSKQYQEQMKRQFDLGYRKAILDFSSAIIQLMNKFKDNKLKKEKMGE